MVFFLRLYFSFFIFSSLVAVYHQVELMYHQGVEMMPTSLSLLHVKENEGLKKKGGDELQKRVVLPSTEPSEVSY